MHLKEPSQLRQAGDTVVEVLIAIAVLALVLGGAFVSTNRSLQSTRGSQERVNAVKLVEIQIEQMRALAAASPDELFGASVPSPFCTVIDNSGPASKVKVVPAGVGGACTFATSGEAPTGGELSFQLSVVITPPVDLDSNPTATITNTWDAIDGVGKNYVELKYRLYE